MLPPVWGQFIDPKSKKRGEEGASAAGTLRHQFRNTSIILHLLICQENVGRSSFCCHNFVFAGQIWDGPPFVVTAMIKETEWRPPNLLILSRCYILSGGFRLGTDTGKLPASHTVAKGRPPAKVVKGLNARL